MDRDLNEQIGMLAGGLDDESLGRLVETVGSFLEPTGAAVPGFLKVPPEADIRSLFGAAAIARLVAYAQYFETDGMRVVISGPVRVMGIEVKDQALEVRFSAVPPVPETPPLQGNGSLAQRGVDVKELVRAMTGIAACGKWRKMEPGCLELCILSIFNRPGIVPVEEGALSYGGTSLPAMEIRMGESTDSSIERDGGFER
jgi:hypothetical protein